MAEARYPKLLQKLALPIKKYFVPQLSRLLGGGSSGAQLRGCLARGKTCSVRASRRAVGRRAAAVGCCIPLWAFWGAQGRACLHTHTHTHTHTPPRLLQTHAPVYHTDQLSCRLFALQQYPKALVQTKTAPVSVSFPFQSKISQTGQQTCGVEEG